MFKKVGVYVGRFQPFHKGHASIVNQIIQENDLTIVVIGSSHQSRSPKNPWNFDERKTIISNHLKNNGSKLFHVVGIRDFIDDNDWEVELQRIIRNHTEEKDIITIYNSSKDASYAYHIKFPNWESKVIESIFQNINSTSIRDAYYTQGIGRLGEYVPTETFQFLQAEMCPVESVHGSKTINEQYSSQQYSRMREEYTHLQNYKKQWDGLKHPVTFVTVDCVIINSQNQVCLVRRKEMPGKRYYALPGGFVKPEETLIQAAVRCAKEKAGIGLDPKLVYGTKVFDQPERSLRGRTITHTFLFKLMQGNWSTYGEWVNINQLFLYEDEMFEDHKLIIEAFI